MLKSAAAKKSKHSSKRKITMEKEFSHMNQLKQVPDIMERRVASIEMRRTLLEGQNIRNNASEKTRLMNFRANHNADTIGFGRAAGLARVVHQAVDDRIAQIDANPANRPYMQQHPLFAQQLIGEQPRYFMT